MPQLDLATQLDRLFAIEPGPFPVISLYLNLQADERGKDRFEPFLRKELPDRIRTYRASSPERQSRESASSANRNARIKPPGPSGPRPARSGGRSARRSRGRA